MGRTKKGKGAPPPLVQGPGKSGRKVRTRGKMSQRARDIIERTRRAIEARERFIEGVVVDE